MRMRAVVAAVAGVWAMGGVATGEPAVGFLKLEGVLADREMGGGGLFMGSSRATLPGVVASLDSVASGEAGVAGVVLRLEGVSLGLTQVEELGAALDRVRASGRDVQVFSENYGPAELLLASHADEVIVQSGGGVSFPGLHVEEMFLADTLGLIGLRMDFVQVGKYKGAEEMLGNSAPSEAWDQNISALLDGIYGQMRAQMMRGRDLTGIELDAAMKACFWADAETAIEHGLIDAAMDRLDLDAHLEKTYGPDYTWDTEIGPASERASARLGTMGTFEALGELMRMLTEGPDRKTTRDTIAVLHVKGAIVDGKSSSGGLFGGSGTTGALTIRKALSAIERDDNVKGVVVRIDSPGGSATASETMLLGLRRVAKDKPVWASVGSMAASGGYYVLVGTEKAYVSPSSIVGSIGVVGGKLVAQGLYEKIKLNVVTRTRGPAASMFATTSDWTEGERAMLRGKMQEVYDLFVERVKQGRPGVEIGEVAEGRLFEGERAVELGMADAIGGVDEAVAAMASSVGLSEGSYDVLDYPRPPSFEEMLEEMFGVRARAGAQLEAIVATGRALLGERAWAQVADGLDALLTARERPVMLVTPRILVLP